jgi:hypothetical protein
VVVIQSGVFDEGLVGTPVDLVYAADDLGVLRRSIERHTRDDHEPRGRRRGLIEKVVQREAGLKTRVDHRRVETAQGRFDARFVHQQSQSVTPVPRENVPELLGEREGRTIHQRVERAAVNRLGIVASHRSEAVAFRARFHTDVRVELDQQQLVLLGGHDRGKMLVGDVHRAALIAATEVGKTKVAAFAELEVGQQVIRVPVPKGLDTLPLRFVGAGHVHRSDDRGIPTTRNRVEPARHLVDVALLTK